jgi:probable F420-dependent oxidoreductase
VDYEDPGWRPSLWIMVLALSPFSVMRRANRTGQPPLVVMRSVLLAMSISLLIILFLLTFIRSRIEPTVARWVLALPVVTGGVSLAAILWLRQRSLAESSDPVAAFRGAFFIGLGLAELPAFLGFVGTFISNGLLSYVIGLPISLVCFGLIAPSRGEIERRQLQLDAAGSAVAFGQLLTAGQHPWARLVGWSPMRIGLALPHYGFSFPDARDLTWPGLVEAARRAERLGFDSVWISDHFFLDLERYGGPPEIYGSVEPFTALAGLAVATERVRLGTLVACAPFRHPAIVAKMATAIDLASGGRFDLGLGAGWYQREFEAFGYRFGTLGERFRRLEETVIAVGALFGEGPVDLEEGSVRLAGAYNHPRPVQQPGPPVWVGGKGGPRLLRLIARHADGWNVVWRMTPEAYAGHIADLERVCEAEGRDPSTVRRSVGLATLMGADERDLAARYRALQAWVPGGALDATSFQDFARDTLTGTTEDCLKRLARFAELGVEEVVVSAASLPFAVFDWSMVDLVGEALLPEAHRL